jgi:Ca2+-binding RTX toxin-like protein
VRAAETNSDWSQPRGAAVLAASCALIAALGAPPASAAVDCNLAGATLTVTMSADGDSADVIRSGSSILVRVGTTAVACTGGAPTVTNTDLIVVNDTSGQSTDFAVNTAFGDFAPGATDEAGLSDEIEIQVNMGSGSDDSLPLVGSPFGDFWRLGKTATGDGVNLNAGSETSGVVPGRDFDLEYFGVDGRLLINGNTSGDTVSAAGGPEFAGPLTTPIHFAEEPLSGSGDDTVVGTSGADVIEPAFGNDNVSGGAGDDRYLEAADRGDDEVDGGPGVDSYEHTDTSIASLRVDLRLTGRQDTGVLGNDALAEIEDVFAGNGDDVLIGSDASNLLGAADGDDLIEGLGGALDMLGGSNGVDTLSYAGATGAVTVDLEAVGSQDTGGAGTDQVDSFESLTGSPFADTLLGSALGNRFEVRDGAGDAVTCRGGADTVIADVEGVDTLAADCENRALDLRPDTQITSGPPSLSDDPTPTFTFESSKPGSTFECSLDGGAFAPCTSPVTLAPVSNGAHRFDVRARDLLGALDLTPATRSFTVDRRAAAANAFGSRTLVALALAARRIPARGPLAVRVTNRNGFEVTGTLSGRTTAKVSVSRRSRVKLGGRRFRVGANARETVELKLPRALRRRLARKGRLSLRLTAKVGDPTGNSRTVAKTIKPQLRRRRTRSRLTSAS